jgi:glycosyltransferase involved in cell wall biosynthesis
MENMMNIGIIIKDFAVGKKFSRDGLPTKSGAEFHAENHALQLMKLGHRVTIMAKKRYWFTKARENINGIDLVRLHAPFRWLEIIIRLLTTHRRLDTFYILGHPAFAVWVILYARLYHKKTVLVLTGKAEIFRKTSWRNRILTQCDRYIALSQEIHDSLITETGISPDKISILGQGISTDRFSKITNEEKNVLRQSHGIGKDDVVLLFCARVAENKGIKTVIEFWPKLHGEFPTSKLLVAGGGQKDLINQLEQLSDNTDNSVIVVGEVDDPKEYYQMSDIYIFPSHHEGLPTTLMEAMSCGLPGVVSDIGGCRDLIQHDISGYLCQVKDTNSFYNYTRQLFLSPEKRQHLGSNGASFVRENLDYKRVIPKLEHILQQDS